MEDQTEENLDGSSVKPMSSLRSYFKRMTKATTKFSAGPPLRPISPKPKPKPHELASTESNLLPSGITGQASLRPLVSDVLTNSAPLTGAVRQRPTSVGPVFSPIVSPADIIEPPSSPPKNLNLNLTPKDRPMLLARPSVNMNSDSLRTSVDVPRITETPLPPVDPLNPTKVAIGDVPFATPPKKNFSALNSQMQTLPRTHGRSLTVDHTSDRVPTEFRIAKVSTNSTENSQSVAVLTAPSQVEYPNISHSNRRPPQLKRGPPEISTRSQTHILDVCGEWVCTSGYTTRIWRLLDGDEVVNIAHGEVTKITSVAFKPAAEPANEGSALWLGNNFGEIVEVEIASQKVVAINNIAHSRREVMRIHRHNNEMWTLDDSGILNVWGPGRQGTPNLEAPSTTYKVPKSATFSIVVGDELWHATGNDIRVFLPTLDGKAKFKILQRPLSQAGVGEVTSGALINSQPDRVYFGHSDGKVSIYDCRNYVCLGTVNVEIYKINSLVGVGDYLWAAYNTGMIYIYDTTCDPWMVKKKWRAHPNPVISLVSDRSSLWKFDRLQVLSLGADNVIRTWDGLLQDDWLEAEMQNQDNRFCDFEQIRTLVMTWNAGASTPSSLRYDDQDATFFPSLLKESNTPDILVFGFQDLVDSEDKTIGTKTYFTKEKENKDPGGDMSHQYRDWRDYLIRCLDDCMPGDEIYHLISTASLVGLFTCIFVRSRLRDRITGVTNAVVRRGLGGLLGNKGALIFRFMLDDTSVCFVNCHLAAGQTQTRDRNLDVAEILASTILPMERDPAVRINSYVNGGDGTMILDHEICIWNGDLNYRIDTMSRDAVISAIKAGNIVKLLERDQLLGSKKKIPGFGLKAFNEMPITFAPTCKYDVGFDTYDSSKEMRVPAWCDRILYRGRDQQRLEQLNYRRHEVRVSDHRPVTGMFCMTVKTVSSERRAAVWEESCRKFEEVKQKLVGKATLDFLSNVCGLDSESSNRMLKQRMGAKP